jgi:hypothetical protein
MPGGGKIRGPDDPLAGQNPRRSHLPPQGRRFRANSNTQRFTLLLSAAGSTESTVSGRWGASSGTDARVETHWPKRRCEESHADQGREISSTHGIPIMPPFT